MSVKKILVAALSAGVIMSFASLSSMADSTTGWRGSNEEGWHYYTSADEYVKNDWKKIDGKWYYFEANGYAFIDTWAYIDGKMYHFDSKGAMEKDKWVNCGEHKTQTWEIETGNSILELPEYQELDDWRYVGSDGAAYTGWKKIGGYWYYFSDNTHWYRGSDYGQYGLMYYGTLYADDTMYCMDNTGKMISDGWYEPEDGIRFYFDSDGRSPVLWEKIDGEWYWFSYWQDDDRYCYSASAGLTWTFDGNGEYGTCVFSDSGKLLTGWQEVEGEWYYSDSDGYVYEAKWLTYKGQHYYFNSDGKMLKNEKSYFVDGMLCNFNSDGVCTNYSSATKLKGWYQLRDNERPSYFSDDIELWVYMDGEGNMYRNRWLYYSGSWYYFGSDGVMVLYDLLIDGKFYEFETNGKCVDPDQNYTGWHRITSENDSTDWFYYGPDHKVVTGWKQIGGKWYYFTTDGRMVYDSYEPIDGKEYVFDKSGALTNGWYLLYGEYWVYTDSDGVLVTNKWIKSGGNWYYVDDFCIVTNYSSYKINGKYYDFDSNGICQNPEGRSGPRVIIIQRE